MKKRNLSGYTVRYKKKSEKGVDYLDYILTADEANSLFRNARYSGKIKFEDRAGRNYTLISKTNGSFIVKKRRF